MLLETCDYTNRVVEEGFAVTYTTAPVNGQWEWTSANMSGTYTRMFETTRRATLRYKYVGLTKNAAESKASSLRTAYTRTVYTQEWDGSVTNGQWKSTDTSDRPTELMTNVVARRVDGDMWEVSVDVNETTTRIGKTSPSTGTFSVEQGWEYDGVITGEHL